MSISERVGETVEKESLGARPGAWARLKNWLEDQLHLRQPKDKTQNASLSYRFLARQIKADLQHKEGGKVILVSSPLPLDLNNESMMMLSCFIGDELGCRLLMVDATLREGGVGTALGHEGAPGMLDVMYGSDYRLRDVILSTVRRDISLIPMGRPSKNHRASLTPSRLAEFFAEARREFDYVLVQQAAVSDDTRYLLFVGEADLTLILVAEGNTLVDELGKCMAVFRDHEVSNVRVVLTTPK